MPKPMENDNVDSLELQNPNDWDDDIDYRHATDLDSLLADIEKPDFDRFIKLYDLHSSNSNFNKDDLQKLFYKLRKINNLAIEIDSCSFDEETTKMLVNMIQGLSIEDFYLTDIKDPELSEMLLMAISKKVLENFILANCPVSDSALMEIASMISESNTLSTVTIGSDEHFVNSEEVVNKLKSAFNKNYSIRHSYYNGTEFHNERNQKILEDVKNFLEKKFNNGNKSTFSIEDLKMLENYQKVSKKELQSKMLPTIKARDEAIKNNDVESLNKANAQLVNEEIMIKERTAINEIFDQVNDFISNHFWQLTRVSNSGNFDMYSTIWTEIQNSSFDNLSEIARDIIIALGMYDLAEKRWLENSLDIYSFGRNDLAAMIAKHLNDITNGQSLSTIISDGIVELSGENNENDIT